MPLDCWTVVAIDDEVMAFRLAGDRLIYSRGQGGWVFRGSQNPAQVGRVVLAEAHVERAGAGESDAVAALTEIMSHRRGEP